MDGRGRWKGPREGRPRTPLAVRFWAKVVKRGDDECWGWTGGFGSGGYGAIGLGGKGAPTIYASRASWMLHFGDIPTGMFVLHRCDNPPCTNPRHLFLGTGEDNVNDMIAKGRNVRGEFCGTSKLSEQEVAEIRFFHISEYTGKGPTSPNSTVFLAQKYGVHKSTIKKIVNNQIWR